MTEPAIKLKGSNTRLDRTFASVVEIPVYMDDCPDGGTSEYIRSGEGNNLARKAKAGTEQAYRISPNPNNGTMTIWRDLDVDKKVAVRIVDLNGATVFASNVSFISNTAGLSVNSLATGIYSIVFEETSGATYHVSFIKR